MLQQALSFPLDNLVLEDKNVIPGDSASVRVKVEEYDYATTLAEATAALSNGDDDDSLGEEAMDIDITDEEIAALTAEFCIAEIDNEIKTNPHHDVLLWAVRQHIEDQREQAKGFGLEIDQVRHEQIEEKPHLIERLRLLARIGNLTALSTFRKDDDPTLSIEDIVDRDMCQPIYSTMISENLESRIEDGVSDKPSPRPRENGDNAVYKFGQEIDIKLLMAKLKARLPLTFACAQKEVDEELKTAALERQRKEAEEVNLLLENVRRETNALTIGLEHDPHYQIVKFSNYLASRDPEDDSPIKLPPSLARKDIREAFSYSKLLPGQFRLLRLERYADSLECELMNIDIGQAPEYNALSYTWGLDPPSKTILANRHPLLITSNLYDALSEIQKRRDSFYDMPRLLWVDAICINQEDNDEKSVQLQLMSSIYKSAEHVLIWLGKSADNSDLAIDNLEPALKAITPLPQSIEGKAAARQTLLAKTDPIFIAIVKLYNRSWFRRLWTLQEAILAKSITVICGSKSIDWDVIGGFAGAISSVYPIPQRSGLKVHDPMLDGFIASNEIQFLRIKFGMETVIDFVNFLQVSRSKQAKVPLDHIYGLLGLASDQIRSLVKVTYDWEVWDGYIQFAKSFIQLDSTLSLLHMASSGERLPTLPSWCPNFQSPSYETIYNRYPAFQAGFKDWKDRKSMIQVSPDSNEIMIPGFRVDTVRNTGIMSLSMALSHSNAVEEDEQIVKALDWEAECLKLCSEVFPETEGVPDEYCATLIAYHLANAEPISIMNVPEAYLNTKNLWQCLSEKKDTLPLSRFAKNSMYRYIAALQDHQYRKFFVTEGGRIGLGPSNIRSGDTVCVFYSASAPFLLRYDSDTSEARLVGDVYIYGLMDLSDIPKEARSADEIFHVV